MGTGQEGAGAGAGAGAEGVWRRCSICKSDMAYGAPYWVCGVSTCNRKSLNFAFCSTSCWDAHVPTMNHREAWCEERVAPGPEGAVSATTAAKPREPQRRVARESRVKQDLSVAEARRDLPRDVLIVASKLKTYVRARSGMNTSDRVLEPLSERVRAICDEAIENARKAERKTVLDRDIPRR